jgi:hypothetical protein
MSPFRAALLVASVGPAAFLLAGAEASSIADGGGSLAAGQAGDDRGILLDAQRCFYNANYAEAAAATLELRAAGSGGLCDSCATLMIDFARETENGQSLARARLSASPQDDAARFFLAKLDLNYLWLELGTLGRKKGWNEYWEARRGLDAVLKRDPGNVRARVARAWIDYIVDTRMPRGTKWVLGGGSRQRALLAVRDAAGTDADFFVRVEAAFALWEMEVRERHLPEAVAVARGLARDVPDNLEVAAFLAENEPTRAP